MGKSRSGWNGLQIGLFAFAVCVAAVAVFALVTEKLLGGLQ